MTFLKATLVHVYCYDDCMKGQNSKHKINMYAQYRVYSYT